MITVSIEEARPQSIPVSLLLEADPSLPNINKYLHQSRCIVAKRGDQIVGACIILPLSPEIYELMNIAVLPEFQKQGIGTQLLKHAINATGLSGAKRMEVGTGTFGYQLTFYQKEGFRVSEIIKDHFIKNYPEPIYENGIQLKDMLRLVLNF